MRKPNIRFDYELDRGVVSYNDNLGRWWYKQAANAVHTYSYRNIADYIGASFSRSPSLIVDYACGCGNLLSRLFFRFPESRLMGLDGSPLLLDHARNRIARRGRRPVEEP